MEPPRVRVYGLYPLTRKTYVRQAIFGYACLLGFLVAWWLGWPVLRHQIQQRQVPALVDSIVRILEWTPWILIGTALLKTLEVSLVLRRFRQKEQN